MENVLAPLLHTASQPEYINATILSLVRNLPGNNLSPQVHTAICETKSGCLRFKVRYYITVLATQPILT